MGRNLFSNNIPQKVEPIPKRAGRNLFADKEQEGSFLQKLPRNLQIGLFNQRQNAVNLPHDLAKNIEEQGNKFGEVVNNALPLEKYIGNNRLPFSNDNQPSAPISEHLPYEQNNYAQLLGERGSPTFMDTIIQKGIEHAPELLAAGNSLRNIIPHLTKRGASKNLRLARKRGNSENIGSLNINPELIEDTRQFLPDTLAYRNLIDEAHKGTYPELFNLQSDVGKLSARNAKSLFSSAERQHGRAGMETRNALLEDLHKSLQSEGHHDISNLLRQGQEDYRKYMKFRPYRNAIGLTAAAAAIPKNHLTNLLKKLLFQNNQ